MNPLNISTQLTQLTATPPPPNRAATPPAPSAEATKAPSANKPESPNDQPANFASALKSQMDKKPASANKAEAPAKSTNATNASSADSQAAADDQTIVTSSDLAALLPLLVANLPVNETGAKAADSNQASVVDPGNFVAPPVIDASVDLPQTNLQSPVFQLTTTETNTGQDALSDQGKKGGQPELIAPLAMSTDEAEVVTTVEIAVDTAIAADPKGKASESLTGEIAKDDFRAFMDRATNLTQAGAGRTEASNASALRVDTPMGKAGWHDEMGQKLTWMVNNNRQQAELVLTPPQLGRVEVTLTMNGDQATAVFTSANPAVREALEDSMQRLRETLADSGVTLGQAQVGAETPNQFAQADEQNNRSHGARGQGERYGADLPLPLSGGSSRPTSGRGMVDIFA